ncbi:MAG: prepilin-type N-terminal cleavage/methylation domain-containing protein [bacterium]
MASKKAFTIVELLVVMAVIGVLLSLAVFGIQALQKSQRETQRLNDLRNIQGTLESFYSKNRRYPTVAELTIGAKDFVITNALVAFATIPIQSLTPQKTSVAYTGPTAEYTPCTVAATADLWYLNYTVTADTAAQEYGLFGCTENGKTTNLGSKNN